MTDDVPTGRVTARTNGRISTLVVAAEYPDLDPGCFDAPDWRRAGPRDHTRTGRGAVVLREAGEETWVQRHYRRGGLVARFVHDSYLWTGLERSRPARELRLLDRLSQAGLPVPRPVAARVIRAGLAYRADLITVLIPDTRPLSAAIARQPLDRDLWTRLGGLIARFHASGIDHPDLNAHNILIGADAALWLLDFDNASERAPGEWRERNLARLKRSLNKVAMETGAQFDTAGWEALVQAYRSA